MSTEAGEPQASRVDDMHLCPQGILIPHVGGPILPKGARAVPIGGKSAARLADRASCYDSPNDVISAGAFDVRINGLPGVHVGCTTVHGGVISAGKDDVLMGGASFEVPANFVLDGDPDWQNKVVRDLFTISTTSKGKVLIDRLAKSGKTITFDSDIGDEGNYTSDGIGGPTIHYDPELGVFMPDSKGTLQPRPPAVGLAHEMGHAEGYATGTRADGPADGYENPKDGAEHARIIPGYENPIRSELGVPERKGDAMRGKDDTENPPQNSLALVMIDLQAPVSDYFVGPRRMSEA